MCADPIALGLCEAARCGWNPRQSFSLASSPGGKEEEDVSEFPLAVDFLGSPTRLHPLPIVTQTENQDVNVVFGVWGWAIPDLNSRNIYFLNWTMTCIPVFGLGILPF